MPLHSLNNTFDSPPLSAMIGWQKDWSRQHMVYKVGQEEGEGSLKKTQLFVMARQLHLFCFYFLFELLSFHNTICNVPMWSRKEHNMKF